MLKTPPPPPPPPSLERLFFLHYIPIVGVTWWMVIRWVFRPYVCYQHNFYHFYQILNSIPGNDAKNLFRPYFRYLHNFCHCYQRLNSVPFNDAKNLFIDFSIYQISIKIVESLLLTRFLTLLPKTNSVPSNNAKTCWTNNTIFLLFVYDNVLKF